MEFKINKRTGCSGFTLLELIVVIVMIGIITAIAIPAFSAWIPDYRLKAAVQELYSNMQLAKLTAIRTNNKCRLVFAASESSYDILRPDETIERTISFLDYDPEGNIGYGCGNAIENATVSGGSLPGDFISYQYNKATFNPNGIGSSGYVYMANGKGTAYAVGTWSSGVIVLKKWNNTTNSWN